MSAQTQIKEWILANGKSIRTTAEEVPVREETLSRWLNGKQMPSAIARNALTAITGLDVRDERKWR